MCEARNDLSPWEEQGEERVWWFHFGTDFKSCAYSLLVGTCLWRHCSHFDSCPVKAWAKLPK